ncbi:DUF5301 domain-containing protein [Clostridium baratii]|uniref:DUF5301 domain-containing protein n=1 Tax=Clostridium baratii TaxID=1561 RepID=UPI002943AC06|nr:DUF5301 domain-containing protein [Clostridium baratii]
MKGNKKIIINIIIFIIGFLSVICFKTVFGNKYTLNVPKLSDILVIELQENEKNKNIIIEDNENILEIYEVISNNKKSTRTESINDTPIESKYIKIDLACKESEITTLFVYEGDNEKYFIEQPYNGIYEITEKDYKTFTQYFL